MEYIMSALRESPVSKHIPDKQEDGWGEKDLENILRAVYKMAKQDGDHWLFAHSTSDIHAGNFGYSLQTNRVIVYDK